MRDEMHEGDGILFYHSNADPPKVVGTATIVRNAYPDPDQIAPDSRYYDERSTPDEPRWVAVDVRYERAFERTVPLEELRRRKSLAGMELLRRGSRLSVQPVTTAQWKTILRMGGLAP